MARKHPVDEERLALERLGDRTGGRIVFGQALVGEFGKSLEHRWKAIIVAAGSTARASDQILAVAGAVAEVQPIDGRVPRILQRRAQRAAGRGRVDAADEHMAVVDADRSGCAAVDRLPGQTMGKVDPFGQRPRLRIAEIAAVEGLAVSSPR